MNKWTNIFSILGIVLIISAYFICQNHLGNNLPAETQTVDSADSSTSNFVDGNSLALEILPTLDSSSFAKNQVWTGVFQLVWNDLANELNKEPIRFADPQPEMVTLLNKSLFSVKDLSASAYYKKLGLVSPELKEEIEKGIWEKFREKSRILDAFNWTPSPRAYFLYAMLKKDLEYVEKFDSLGYGSFKGSENEVDYFGVTKSVAPKVKESVKVLFYNYEDFAVALQTKTGDIIYLYNTNSDKTLAQLYTEMKLKANENKDKNDSLGLLDEFKAPKLDFAAKREFEELYGKEILPSRIKILGATESVQFKIDEIGARVVAEAGVYAVALGGAIPQGRYFYFTGPYVLFIEEPGKQPYFAAYISDVAALQQPER